MSVNKFKVGDVVKCVNANNNTSTLTVGKEYVLVAVNNYGMVKVENDKGVDYLYYHYRFELSKGSDLSPQPHKFKEGDMVYLIGFGCLKPRKLQTRFNNGSPMKFKVEVAKDVFETFTEYGKCLTIDTTPSIVLATEENCLMLNKLLGVEYEPVKLTGSDLAKKLLKDKPQTCYVSDNSDEHATSSGRVLLIIEFENDRFISKGVSSWKFAVPCNQHGRILDGE